MNENIWKSWFPDDPMPEGITVEEFFAARNAVWDAEALESSLELIQMYDESILHFSHDAALTQLLRTSRAIILKDVERAKL